MREIVQRGNLTLNMDDSKILELIFTGNNLKEELKAIVDNNIDSVVFNRYFCGRRIGKLDFIKDISSIKRVRICNDDFDIDSLYYLNDLEELILSGKQRLDYSRFSKLRVLSIRHPGPYIFPDSIQKLYIWHMKLKELTLDSIRFPKSLQELYLYWTDIQSLEGLSSNLKTFGIYMSRNLRSLKGLSASADTLQKLEIENCPHLEDYH